jgi:hypothetical protein
MTAKQIQMASHFVGLLFGGKIFWGKFGERVLLQKQQKRRIGFASQRTEIEWERGIE